MSAAEPPQNPENAKEGPFCEKKPRSKKLSKEHPRSIRFDEIEIAIVDRILTNFPHLKSQVDAVRYAVRSFSSNPSPIQFRSHNPEILFIVQGLLDEIYKAHRHNQSKALRLRPKNELTQEEALQTLKVINSETDHLARVARELSAHCKLSSEITPEDIQNIKASIISLEKSIKTFQENGKHAQAKQYISVLKVLKGLVS